jgi:hypothetical protein
MSIKPQNLPEKLIWYYITWNYFIYLLGAQFVLAPLLAWFLLVYLVVKWWSQDENTPLSEQIHLSTTAWISIVAMLVVAITYLMGSLDFEENYYVVLRNFFNGWVRMWSLLVIFPLIGSLQIRPQIIVRAVTIFCIQSLFLVVLFWIIAFATGGNSPHYTSPLFKFGGLTNYYTVVIGNWVDVYEWRLQMISPWATAMGLVADIYFFLTLQETDKRFRYLGMLGAIAIILSTFSRTAIVGLPVVFIFSLVISRLRNPIAFIMSGFISFLITIFIDVIINFFGDFIASFKKYRQGSTKVREELQFMALEAWKKDAPILGHGSFSMYGSKMTGGHSVASDNTLIGVLFQLGIVGGLALGAMYFSVFIRVIQKALENRDNKIGLEILSVLSIYLLTENIEASAYLYWPGLVMLGIVLKDESMPKNYNVLSAKEHRRTKES